MHSGSDKKPAAPHRRENKFSASKYFVGLYEHGKFHDYVYHDDEDGNNVSPFTDDETLYFHNVLD